MGPGQGEVIPAGGPASATRGSGPRPPVAPPRLSLSVVDVVHHPCRLHPPHPPPPTPVVSPHTPPVSTHPAIVSTHPGCLPRPTRLCPSRPSPGPDSTTKGPGAERRDLVHYVSKRRTKIGIRTVLVN